MESIDEKLDRFSAIVLQDAREERDKLIEETESKYKSIMSEKEKEHRQEAYADIQKRKAESVKRLREEILHIEMDSKKQLFKKRGEIINSVIDAVNERLVSFVKSDEYTQWLKNKTKRAMSETGEGKKVVYVSDSDMRYKDMLERLSEKITVKNAADRNFIGGVKVYNPDRRISVDYSFKELLDEEKQSFLQRSGLAIN